MAEEFVNIEVNGVPVKARKGEMIIRATDAIGAYVPRFCYHDKLSIAANCRMCLVEVEKAPKPLPACATPVAEGMKIFTQSPKATGAFGNGRWDRANTRSTPTPARLFRCQPPTSFCTG